MDQPYTLHLGDSREILKTLPDCSVDAIVTDPPYGIRFMGMAWDAPDIETRTAARRSLDSHSPGAGPNGGHKSAAAEAGKYDLSPAAMRAFQDWTATWCREAMRVLKPGGHLLVFASARTYHRMACGVEEAGFELRDQIMWLYGSGFPKSHNLDGAWEGWGTALKPAHEPICVARKPIVGTVAANVLAHGTGALHIDACRVETNGEANPSVARRQGAINHLSTRSAAAAAADGRMESRQSPEAYRAVRPGEALGRWPANVIHDGSDEVVAAFPDAPGQQGPISSTAPSPKTGNIYGRMRREGEPSADSENRGALGFKMRPGARRLDEGSAARFFYCAKASRAERNEGLEDPGPQFAHGTTLRQIENAEKRGNHHPTVKPTDLMAYLCRLVTPAGGLVLDPFMGSGSTGKACMREGFRFVGIDLTPEYVDIARTRIEHELRCVQEAARAAAAPSPQLALFDAV